MDLPAEEVPPEAPEPALGINFARDGMSVSLPTPGPPAGYLLLAPRCFLGRASFHGLALSVCPFRRVAQKKDWLGLVAVHSDAWLLALAFYKGARLDKDGR